jgi:glycosyltransferase involved in cell wall biosynthesis
MRYTDIILFSSSDWDGKWGSRQMVAMHLAKRGYRILFVEQMAGAEHMFRYSDVRVRRFRRRRNELFEIHENIWLLTPPPLLPGRYYLPDIATLNARIVERLCKSSVQKLNFQNPVLWLYKPEHSRLIGRLGERAVVYHCIDEYTAGISGRKRQVIQSLEAELMQRANVVFANSQLTYENKRHYNPHTYHLPSAADVAHFSTAADITVPVSPELAHLPHPQLLVLGNINEKIDIPLLNGLAGQRPDWTLILIGQVNGPVPQFDELCAKPNVHYLGKRRYADLPSLLRSADLCLLPYVQGEITRYRSPLKLYEYLATGKPIVSTPHPEVEQFNEFVTIASRSGFISAIENTLAHDTQDKKENRIAVARQQTWDNRIDRMIEYLNSTRVDLVTA